MCMPMCEGYSGAQDQTTSVDTWGSLTTARWTAQLQHEHMPMRLHDDMHIHIHMRVRMY